VEWIETYVQLSPPSEVSSPNLSSNYPSLAGAQDHGRRIGEH
jgi:hypothetical protein